MRLRQGVLLMQQGDRPQAGAPVPHRQNNDGEVPAPPAAVKRVLFLCTGNACRSQLAEALANHYYGDRLNAVSAGTSPAGVHPRAVAVLAELGINWSQARSKNVSEFVGQKFDQVITLCGQAQQACPLFPGKTERLHWGLPDLAAVTGSEEEIMTAFRAVRDELREKLAQQFGNSK